MDSSSIASIVGGVIVCVAIVSITTCVDHQNRLENATQLKAIEHGISPIEAYCSRTKVNTNPDSVCMEYLRTQRDKN